MTGAPARRRYETVAPAAQRRRSDAAMLPMIDNYDSFTYNRVESPDPLAEDAKVLRDVA